MRVSTTKGALKTHDGLVKASAAVHGVKADAENIANLALRRHLDVLLAAERRQLNIKNDLAAVQARLAEAEEQKDQAEDHIGELTEKVEGINQRADAAEAVVIEAQQAVEVDPTRAHAMLAHWEAEGISAQLATDLIEEFNTVALGLVALLEAKREWQRQENGVAARSELLKGKLASARSDQLLAMQRVEQIDAEVAAAEREAELAIEALGLADLRETADELRTAYGEAHREVKQGTGGKSVRLR